MKVTVLSPHRDDAAFSVGLAIAEWLKAGHVVEVVNCFTDSEYSPFGGSELVSGIDRRVSVSEERRCEDVAWSRQYHPAVELIDLHLHDAPERLGCSVDEVCGFPVRQNDPAMASIRSGLQQRSPEALLLPLGIGNHVDHVTARLAAQHDWPATLPIAFYEDLPYSARPCGDETIEPRVASLAMALTPAFVSPPTDLEAAAQRKRLLCDSYGSQIDGDIADLIAQFSERYCGRERLWVNAAWREAVPGGPQ